MSYIQNLIDSQDNIIIICDDNFGIKNINKTYYNFFHKDRIYNIIETVKSYDFDKEYKLPIRNYKDEKYTFLIKLTKVEKDIIINMINITKVSAYKKSLLQSNFNFLEYQNLIDKFLIVSKTDTKGIITYVNDNFIKISGYEKEDLVGKPHNIIRHPDMAKCVFKSMWKTISQGKIWQGVVKNKKKNGKAYFVKTLIAPLLNSKGKINEYIAFRVDITELIKAKEKAQKSKKAKEMFLANMSHEIRTPLTGILGFIEILKNESLPNKTKHIIDIIDNSADTLLNVVNDILEISKIETEGVTIHLDKFDAKSSFENTIELFTAKVKEKNINYIYNINIDSCIISDEHRLKQVLSNLIGNAVKFTSENGEIKIDINSYEKEKKLIVDFSIQDSGIGIPKEKQDKLFKPFSQIESEEKFGGTGLGLYISSQIVKKLGGELKVESEENKGTKFYFSLEFEKCEKIKKKKTKEISVKGKILIAEDNKVNQELLKAILQRKGDIDITMVENGKEAIEAFKIDKFDLVFLDIFMPVMNGDEAVKEILSYENENNLTHTPVVALTANALRGDKEKYLELGFNNYISKPIKHKQLDDVLNKYLAINLDENLELEDIMKDLRELYLLNVIKDLDILYEAIQKNDFKNIEMYAHKIAGSSVSVGFDDVGKLAKEMELFAKTQKNLDYFKLFDKISKMIQLYSIEVDTVSKKG